MCKFYLLVNRRKPIIKIFTAVHNPSVASRQLPLHKGAEVRLIAIFLHKGAEVRLIAKDILSNSFFVHVN